jgi:protein SCO1/2
MIPLDMTFIDEKGKKVTLKQMMDGKPTMLSLNYYRCSGICNAQLSDMAKMLGELDLKENRDYKVITVSFGEGETSVLADAKRNTMLKAIPRKFDHDAWHFYVSDGNSSAQLAEKVGFTYKKEISKAGVVDYIHPGTLIMISPEGKVTRYLNGINQLPFDVKMAVMEAGEGKVGPTIAKKLLLCFAYDPKGKTYVFQWEKIAGIVITLIMILFFIYLVLTSDRKEIDNQQNKGDE